jgi:pilus assembly protein CpaB
MGPHRRAHALLFDVSIFFHLGANVRLSTVLMLGGAAICALIATSLTASLFNADRPKPVVVAAPVVAPAPEVRKIVVAARPLPFGTPLTADALKEIPWPTDYNMPGTYSGAAALALERRTVLSAIGENEPIVQSRLSGPGQYATFSALIRSGMTAVTIRVDDVMGVAGLVQPEDHVNVLLTQNPGAARATQGDPYSATLLQNVRVLAVDQNVDRARQAKPARAVTLEVDLEQAQKLTLAASVGQLSLALRKAGSTGSEEVRRSEVTDLPRQPAVPEAPVETTPVKAEPVVVKVGPTNLPIGVTRGVERKVYDVLVDGATDVQRVAAIRRAQAGESLPRHAFPTIVSPPEGDASKEEPVSEDGAEEAVTPR